jgi:hypothetical protein
MIAVWMAGDVKRSGVLFWGALNIAFGDEAERYADEQNVSDDAVQERPDGEVGLGIEVGGWNDDVVHDAVDGDAVDGSGEDGPAVEWEFAADIDINSGDGESDEVVDDQSKGRGDHAIVICERADEAGSDGLRDSNCRDAHTSEEDEGVREIEGADKQSGTCDDKQKRRAAIG